MADDLSEMATVHKLTRAQFHALYEAGVLRDGDDTIEDPKVELIDGRIVTRPMPSPQHSYATRRLLRRLVQAFLDRPEVEVDCQGSFFAEEYYEPQPDLAIIPRWDDATELPSRAFLIVEVSRSRLRYDRMVKQPLYARIGVPEYWIVNVVDREVEVYRQPSADGYRSVETRREGDVIAPAEFPDVTIEVSELFSAEVSR